MSLSSLGERQLPAAWSTGPKTSRRCLPRTGAHPNSIRRVRLLLRRRHRSVMSTIRQRGYVSAGVRPSVCPSVNMNDYAKTFSVIFTKPNCKIVKL